MRRKAFGQPIRNFQAVGFKVADCATLPDMSRATVYSTCLAIDSDKVHPGRIRRMISQSKKVSSEAAWEVINHCLQVVGGIGYTNVYPLERILRDIRLSMMWVGTNEIMQLIIQTEWYKEFQDKLDKTAVRNVEDDSPHSGDVEEKIFAD